MSYHLDILAVHPSCVVQTNRAILRELISRGLSVEVVVPKASTEFESHSKIDPPTPDDPKIHELEPRFSVTPSRKRTYQGLRGVISQRRPRFVWIEDEPASLLALQLGILKRIYGFELISFSVENMVMLLREAYGSNQLKRYMRHELLGYLTRLSSPFVDRVLVCSRDGERLMSARGFAGRVLKTPIGYDPELFKVDEALRNATRSKLGLHEFTIAYFGRVVPEKGVEDLVRALGELKDARWQFLLDKFSDYDNPFIKTLNKAIDEEGIRERVVFFDASHSQMPAYMNAADLMVAPSRNTPNFKEQYGRVVPEALACGCQVIVTDAGALPELVGSDGHVVAAGDQNALVRQIQSTLQSFDAGTQHSKRTTRGTHLNTKAQADLLVDWFKHAD